jgi:hypothetical protein
MDAAARGGVLAATAVLLHAKNAATGSLGKAPVCVGGDAILTSDAEGDGSERTTNSAG